MVKVEVKVTLKCRVLLEVVAWVEWSKNIGVNHPNDISADIIIVPLTEDATCSL